MEKNEKINLIIENLGCNAEGVGKSENKVVFVPYTLPKEQVETLIINSKSHYAIGKAERIITKSEDRILPPCPYYTKCGGCQLQHANYSATLKIKTQLVQNAITNIAKINFKVAECFASESQYQYRNKIAMPINPKTRKVGMFRPLSHNIVDVENCLLQKKLINSLINVFNDYLLSSKISIYDDSKKDGIIKHLVARELNNQLLVTVVINADDLEDKQTLINMLKDKFDKFGLSLNINKLCNNVILTEKFVQVFGLKSIELCEFGVNYSINNQSFLQINDDTKKQMYQKIFEQIDNSTVIDAYSGAGLLSAMMSKHSKKVIGIEIISEATKFADKLKTNNNIENLQNVNGDCAVELPKIFSSLNDEEKKNLIVVLDPPRKGCDKNVLESILSAVPKKVIYMSCEPSTLSRDIYALVEKGQYKVISIEPFDMFPQTKHVETLAVLQKI